MNIDKLVQLTTQFPERAILDSKTIISIGMEVGVMKKDLDQLGFDGLSKLYEILRHRQAVAGMNQYLGAQWKNTISDVLYTTYGILLDVVHERLVRRRSWVEIERFIRQASYAVNNIDVQNFPLLSKVTLDHEVAYLDPTELPFPQSDLAEKLIALQMAKGDNTHAK